MLFKTWAIFPVFPGDGFEETWRCFRKSMRMKKRQVLVVLGLGSNWDRERNMERAEESLRVRFPGIRFSGSRYTEPVGSSSPRMFLNQVACFYSEEPLEKVRDALKEIERGLGRKPEDKRLGSIPIDIDLLRWGDRVLKEDDWQRPYVREGARSLLPADEDDERGDQETERPAVPDK